MGDVALRGTQINVGTHEPDLRCILKFSAKINKWKERGKDPMVQKLHVLMMSSSHNMAKTGAKRVLSAAFYIGLYMIGCLVP